MEGKAVAGATVNGCNKDFPDLSLPGSNDKSVVRIPTKLLPGLQAANAGNGELWEFSQQQQFSPALIICGSGMLQVFVINSGQPCNELLSASNVKMNILENNLYIVIASFAKFNLQDITPKSKKKFHSIGSACLAQLFPLLLKSKMPAQLPGDIFEYDMPAHAAAFIVDAWTACGNPTTAGGDGYN